ncbi:hypothetical protein [Clostridium aminobutyricum]|uniref:Uncharacterized protein n=1 Tax=Clostridium aminobutyricum TaxID=33953 RepID=A0A939IK81_CLOAM|nr:hypothetical protein [Clostridium aminobutyricum]MBN7774329.1 hypothetical protein [Clostridium aminobutyricum]
MKTFTCHCLDGQFKSVDKVYVSYSDQYPAEIPCIYRPNGKSTLRRIRLETNYCPMCGAKLEELAPKA